MISPSRNAAPTRLLGGTLRDRDVARLEFHPVGWVAEEMVADDVFDDQNGVASELEQNAAAVDMGTETGALEIQAQIEIALKDSRTEWTEELEARVAEERGRVGRVCEEFARERSRYFAGVEAEVVRLALAIAARVLHREAMLDPLLLGGVVRVALEKVKDESSTILRVPVAEVEMWRSAALHKAMDVVGDERMNPSECVLETSIGRVELGVGAQLEEIEKGFFDLLQKRPS